MEVSIFNFVVVHNRKFRAVSRKLTKLTYRSQHVSVESSSLLHHSIYLWFICFTWWSIDELENLHADRTTVCFEPWQKLRARLGARKTGLNPPVFLYWPFRSSASVVVPCCSCCLCLYFGSSIVLVACFVNFRQLNDYLFGKRAVHSVCRGCLSWAVVNLCI